MDEIYTIKMVCLVIDWVTHRLRVGYLLSFALSGLPESRSIRALVDHRLSGDRLVFSLDVQSGGHHDPATSGELGEDSLSFLNKKDSSEFPDCL